MQHELRILLRGGDSAAAGEHVEGWRRPRAYELAKKASHPILEAEDCTFGEKSHGFCVVQSLCKPPPVTAPEENGQRDLEPEATIRERPPLRGDGNRIDATRPAGRFRGARKTAAATASIQEGIRRYRRVRNRQRRG